MQKNSISRISMVAAPLIVGFVLLASGDLAMAQSDDGPCSN